MTNLNNRIAATIERINTNIVVLIISYFSCWYAAVFFVYGDLLGTNPGRSFLHGTVLQQWVHRRLSIGSSF